MGQNNSRKRKRVTQVSPSHSVSEYDDDIIHVAPRPHTASRGSTERTPLAETQTRGNRARRAHTAQHVHGMPFTLSSPLAVPQELTNCSRYTLYPYQYRDTTSSDRRCRPGHTSRLLLFLPHPWRQRGLRMSHRRRSRPMHTLYTG